jgi:hypothetical protein
MKKTRDVKWQTLERIVRTIAEMKFSGRARAEDIAGVKCDCVIHLDDGSVVVVEISKEKTALRENSEKRPIGGGLSVLPSWDCWHQDSGLGRTI